MYKIPGRMPAWRWLILILGCIAIAPAFPDEKPAEMKKYRVTVNILQKNSGGKSLSADDEAYINGFRGIISGQKITYHSSHPNAEDALIARARRDMQSISWMTDTLVSAPGDSFYRLLWLAGIERAGWESGGTPRIFRLFINGERWFTFMNLKDSSAYRWTVNGNGGASLSFQSDMEDRYGDLFGRMTMRLPAQHFPAGTPLTIRVDAENVESSAWFMTFAYSFSFIPSLRAEPAILRDESRDTRMVKLSIDNLCGRCSVEVTGLEKTVIKRELAVGANNLFLPMEAVGERAELELIYQRNGKTVLRRAMEILPVIERDIYILPYSHNDIGYTDLQKNIEKKQWQNLDQALDLIGKTRTYSENARFKWNLEVTWPLETYLDQASDDKRRAVIEESRNGNICINALFANILTGLVSDAEMNHITEFARNFSRTNSVPVTTAVVSDIPGFTWGIVTTLAQSGVQYFSIAPNSGDRVGHIYEGLGDKPFYWTSQSGEEKVLTWLAAASYSTFHEGELSRLGEEKSLNWSVSLTTGITPTASSSSPIRLVAITVRLIQPCPASWRSGTKNTERPVSVFPLMLRCSAISRASMAARSLRSRGISPPTGKTVPHRARMKRR